MTDGRVTPGNTQKKKAVKATARGSFPTHQEGGLHHAAGNTYYMSVSGLPSLTFPGLVALWRRETCEPQSLNTRYRWNWTAALTEACTWHGLCQTPWQEAPLGQLTAVVLALPWLPASSFWSKSPGDRWRAVCGSISLTCVCYRHPGWGEEAACLLDVLPGAHSCPAVLRIMF